MVLVHLVKEFLVQILQVALVRSHHVVFVVLLVVVVGGGVAVDAVAVAV